MTRRERRNLKFASQRAAAAAPAIAAAVVADMGTDPISQPEPAAASTGQPPVVSDAPSPAAPPPSAPGASTGPRSKAGKAVSSRNAVKHNLTATILTGDDLAHYNALLAALVAEWEPRLLTEELLLRQMALQQWRMDRALSLEMEALSGELNEKLLSLVIRYRTTAERAFHKALTEIQKFRNNLSILARREAQKAQQECDEIFERWMRTPLGTSGFVPQMDFSASNPRAQFVSQGDPAARKPAATAAKPPAKAA